MGGGTDWTLYILLLFERAIEKTLVLFFKRQTKKKVKYTSIQKLKGLI